MKAEITLNEKEHEDIIRAYINTRIKDMPHVEISKHYTGRWDIVCKDEAEVAAEAKKEADYQAYVANKAAADAAEAERRLPVAAKTDAF